MPTIMHTGNRTKFFTSASYLFTQRDEAFDVKYDRVKSHFYFEMSPVVDRNDAARRAVARRLERDDSTT